MKETDQRVIKTKQLLKDAFYELMEADGFSKITIENLAKKAGISRNTFYLHYTDKYDLFSQLEDELLNEIKQILIPLPKAIMESRGYSELGSEGKQIFLDFYNSIQKNRRFFNAITSHGGNSAFWGRFSDVFRDNIQVGYPKELFLVPVRYYTAVIVGIQTGIVRQWVINGMEEDPGELVDLMVMILRGLAKNLFMQEIV